ncbi:hypothetical protein [Rubeoparvulum massiliense]|uniref:hypothetical protein n=1 Tax=Rubeoparvulum massiliense TaxID=1631346 RepID=UPI00065E31C8|nr:hypothetical protein [Rubeoparvulum massiliense]
MVDHMDDINITEPTMEPTKVEPTNNEKKATWRVGTLSMGLTLILLGIFFLASLWFDWDGTLLIKLWWPVLLIILGCEIFIYLLRVGKDARVRYDLFSIFIVAIIGFSSIALNFFNSTGLINAISREIGSELQNGDLLPWKYGTPLDIKYLVVETGEESVQIEGSDTRDIHLFGTYSAWVGMNEQLPEMAAATLVQSYQVEDTLYIKLKPARESYRFANHLRTNLTLTLPRSLKTEIRGNYGVLEVTPGQLKNDWRIEAEGDLKLRLLQSADQNLQLLAGYPSQDVAQLLQWQKVESQASQSNEENSTSVPGGYPLWSDSFYRTQLQTGNGGHQLHVEAGQGLDVVWVQ